MPDPNEILQPGNGSGNAANTASAGTSSASGTATQKTPTTTNKTIQSAPNETLDAFRTRTDNNQTMLYRKLESLIDVSRRNQEASDAKFAAIQTQLAAMLVQQQPTGPATTSGDSMPTVTRQNSIESSDSQHNGPTTEPFSGAISTNNSHDSSNHRQQAARKLHDLPVFSGAPEDWPKFNAMFRQSTDAYGYSALDNCIRLQRCLTGEAKETVDCLLLDVNGTEKVMEALEFRYGRPELLAQAQLRRVRELPPIPENKAEMIIPFASKVANMLAYLDQPKTKQYLANPELLEQLVQKLPLSRRHDWGRHAVDIEPCASVHHFSTWLNNLARCVSYMTPAASLANASQPQQQVIVRPRSSGVQQQQQQSATTNRRERSMYVSRNKQQCAACDKIGHDIADCRRFEQLNVKERWNTVRSQHLCFSCLRRGHGTAQCEARNRCGIDGCEMPHHILLHQPSAPSSNTSGNPFSRGQRLNVERTDAATGAVSTERAASSVERTTSTDAASNSDNAGRQRVQNCQTVSENIVLCRIIPVCLYHGDNMVKTYALFDEGSTVTMIDESIARNLELSGPDLSLSLQFIGGRRATESSRIVAFRISGIGVNHKQYDLCNVQTNRNLDLPTQTVNMAELAERFPQLRGLPLDNYNNATPTLLIGADYLHLGVAIRQVSHDVAAPVATKTRLGWVIGGPRKLNDAATVSQHCRVVTKSSSVLDGIQQTVDDYFGLENFGVRHTEAALESRDDKRARIIMVNTTKRIGNRFETGLLWRLDAVHLPDSMAMATKRLHSVERKMSREPTYAAEYNAIIDNFINKGYARMLSESEAAVVDTRTWYLPHFAIVNPNKPGKMRVVFDAAATVNGVSLNSLLLKGPDLNKPLLTVLHRFRIGVVGVCADIREMFLQVRIRQQDVNSQRFLWRRGDVSRGIDVYVMQAMIFGAACSPSSAQHVKNYNADEHQKTLPDAVKLIKEAHYVDDFVASFDGVSEAVRVTKAVTQIHQKGGFELRGFVCNEPAVLRAIDGDNNTTSTMDMQLHDDKPEKILGMYWNTDEDCFLFRLAFNRVDPAVVDGRRRPTKREILSATMSVYDPFGVLANFTIYAKLLLQELWRHGTGWDEFVHEDLHAKWLQWVAKLDVCRQVRVPRCYTPGIASKRVQLHMFADASQSAYATVAYWRVEIEPSVWSIAFVVGKSRCAPPKMISVPRLELQAAILAVRIKNSVREMHNFDIERTFFWSDSKTVVQWVRSTTLQFRPFVAHRIGEILEETDVNEWNWVPTQQNAADDATRAKYPVRFEADNRWISGPDFLLLDESEWPQEPAEMLCNDGAEEVRPFSAQMVCTIRKLQNSCVQITRFSDFHRLCRSMAVALRFLANLRTQSKVRGELLPEEIENAERHLIRAVQAETFAEELATLRCGKPVDKSSSIRSLLPHIDKYGLIRMTGRADKALHLPEDARNPIVLPKNHPFTTLLVVSYHRRLRHQQQATVICEIRLKYWVPHLRVIVKRVKSACMLCRMKSARAAEPVMGQLPTDRVTPFVRPFTYSGIDYFGPVFVTIGRRREKRWVALMTCMTTRAVHLELASDLSTDACIICLRNFINLRGVPKQIRSDNGTNFVGASRELRDAVDMLDHAAIQRELSVNRIEWLFNCPSHPQAGGCWERLVQSVKRVLSTTVKEIAPQVETLRSLLLEAANIVNSRPLTHLPVQGDEDEPLTPNHFLLGSASSTQTPGADDPRVLCMRKQFRIAQALKNRFWKRWILEYLPDLTRRSKGYEETPAITIGALVLICDPLLPRGQWRRGRIVDVYPGPDGRIRTACVRMADGGELKRPVSKLAILDVGV